VTKQVPLRRNFYIVCGLTTSVIVATIYITFECGQLLNVSLRQALLGLLKLFATICLIDSGGVELARNLKIRPLNIQYESYAQGC